MEWNILWFTYLVFLALPVFSEAFLRNESDFEFWNFRRSDAVNHEEKCVDTKQKTASAKDCFDYFVFAISWVPTYAYTQKLLDIPIKDLPARWVIHGLWPSWIDRRDEFPPCNRIDQFFVEHRLKNYQVITQVGPDTNLHTNLRNAWFSVLRNRAEQELWDLEFKRHGNCATRAKKIKDMVGYFRWTLEYYYKIGIHNALPSNTIAGKSMKVSDIINKISAKVQNKKFKVKYIKKEDDPNVTLLSEVLVCLDVELDNYIDCPYIGRQEQDASVVVTFPEKAPNVPSTSANKNKKPQRKNK